MSSVPLPFAYRRRMLRGLGQPGQPAIGPAVLAPWDDSSGDGEIQDDPHSHRPDLPPWIYQPSQFENLDQINYVLLPAINSTATIISFVVPAGRNGIINKVACNFVGGGWVEGTGDIVWRILVDGTPPPGATSYDTILASLGGPAQPTGIAGFRIFENQLVTLVIFNNPGGPNGGVVVAGQRGGGRLAGWTYPRDIEEQDIWI